MTLALTSRSFSDIIKKVPIHPKVERITDGNVYKSAMLQARGIIPGEEGKHSRSENNDNEIHVGPDEGVIDLESNSEDGEVRLLLLSRMEIYDSL
jgi:hypothetical protein